MLSIELSITNHQDNNGPRLSFGCSCETMVCAPARLESLAPQPDVNKQLYSREVIDKIWEKYWALGLSSNKIS